MVLLKRRKFHLFYYVSSPNRKSGKKYNQLPNSPVKSLYSLYTFSVTESLQIRNRAVTECFESKFV